ncbi:MAG TPA: PEGA domain-containing protein [Lacunisphaera sp.]
MEQKDPSQPGHDTPPAAGAPRKNARQAADDNAPLPESVLKAKGFYDKLFPPDSPRRKAGPWVIIAAVLIVLLVGKCAVSSAGHKITEVTQARAEEKRVRTTGVLLVKSNRPEATIEAVRLASADDPSTDRVSCALGQTLPNLTPGKYAVKLRTEGWPDALGEVDVPPGQQTEAIVNFKTGSLRLETVPAGATVKLGKAVLGKTPLLIPQLPPGENDLSLEYPSWPAVPHRATITENQETAATVRLPHGRLVVDSFPAGATVVLQGKAYNKTPLFFDPIAVGPHKLTLQMKNFPPMEISADVADGTETKVRPILGTAFPLLDPAALLSAVWLPDDSNVARVTTGLYKARNDVVKNLRRDWLYNGWLNKIYRYSGPIKSYDAATGRVEFAEQKSDLARYRLVALVKPGTPSPVPPKQDPKDKTPAVLSLYGRLTAVDEPSWPGRVITLELTEAEFLPDGTP